MLHWQLVFHQFIRPKSLCQRLRAITGETIGLLRGNGVGFKASKVHFWSTSVTGFVFTEEAPKAEEAGASTSSTEQGGLYQDYYIWRTLFVQEQGWQGRRLTSTRTKKNQFCSTSQFCSSPTANFQVSSTFEDFILIPTGSKSFGQGTESRAGLE